MTELREIIRQVVQLRAQWMDEAMKLALISGYHPTQLSFRDEFPKIHLVVRWNGCAGYREKILFTWSWAPQL